MKQKIFFLGVLILSSFSLFAQTPQYKFTGYIDAFHTNISRSFTSGSGALRVQSIYYPTDFPGMPAGVVKNVYCRIGRLPIGSNAATYQQFTLKIGHTSDSMFSLGSGQWDTFKTGLTTVYGPATYTTLADSVGRWVKIPLTTLWSYIPESKFVVEFSMGTSQNASGFDIMSNNRGTIYENRTVSGPRDSIRVFNNSNALMMDIGFDFQTTGVEAQGNFSSFGVFPNPSQGRFMVSLESAKALGSVSFYLSNMAGQLVGKKVIVESGTAMLQELNFGSLVPGVYLLEVSSGADILRRRVMIK
ncbi:MAG: T9SS type A sorting domain-containing protein [Chitinophagaceae bacterium]